MRMLSRLFLIAVIFLSASASNAKEECNRSFSDVYRDVAPLVVRIHVIRIDPFRMVNRVSRTIGAGVVIEGSRIVTNTHLIWQANAISVVVNGEQRSAWIVGADPISDIAVLEVQGGLSSAKTVKWGDSDAVSIGEDVIAIGHPIALSVSATSGIISGVSRVLPISPLSWLIPLIQTDAAIFPGNSGGPLVNRCGLVIGINTLRLEGQSGINFAVPSNLVNEIVAELIENRRIIRPWHGIHGRVIDDTLKSILQVALGVRISHGFLVETIEPGSPAQTAGLKGGSVPVIVGGNEYLVGGDIITHVNDEPLKTLDQVVNVARALKVGDRLAIRYIRNGNNHSVDTKLVERPFLEGDVRRFTRAR